MPALPSSRPIICLGEALIDLIAADPVDSLAAADAFVARNGGAPANAAVALARLGLPSAFCGAVGDDPFGQRLRAALAAEQVDTSRIVLRDAPTTLAFAWKDTRGDGRFWLLRNADSTLTPADIDAANIENAAAVVVGSVALAAEPSRVAIHHAVHRAVRANVPVCFDVNLRASLWPDLALAQAECQPVLTNSIVLKLSVDDARGLLDGEEDPTAIVRSLAETARIPVVVLTDGERGSWYHAADGQVRHVRAITVDAVEPTGAGDAFFAALISRLCRRDWTAPDEADIRYAAAAGALATLRPGAWDGLPTAAELDAFMASSAMADS